MSSEGDSVASSSQQTPAGDPSKARASRSRSLGLAGSILALLCASRSRSLGLAGSILALLCAIGCGLRADETIGGETHFLRKCGGNVDVCGGFDCLSEVCSWSCREDLDCSSLPGASCAPIGGNLLGGEEAGRCDVRCSTDDDCRVVSSAHRCDAGACRADLFGSVTPSSTTSPDVVPNDPPTTGDDGSSNGCAPGAVPLDYAVPPNHRVVLGDSFFATAEPLAGVLGSDYRDHARLAFNALALGGRGLDDQYTLAVGEGPVDMIVMTGGGADVLLGSCSSIDSTCPVIADATAAARDLFERFTRDGIAQVLYVSYPDPLVPAVRERMDVLRPLLEDVCRASVVPCQFIDLRPVFDGHYDVYVQEDGLNPTETGTRAIADTLASTMDGLCVAR